MSCIGPSRALAKRLCRVCFAPASTVLSGCICFSVSMQEKYHGYSWTLKSFKASGSRQWLCIALCSLELEPAMATGREFGFSSTPQSQCRRGRWDLAQQHMMLTSLHLLKMSAPSVENLHLVETLQLQRVQLTCMCMPQGWAEKGLTLVYCRMVSEVDKRPHSCLNWGPEPARIPRPHQGLLKILRVTSLLHRIAPCALLSCALTGCCFF